MQKYWVAVEDVATAEVTDFEEVDEKEVLYLMDGYKVNMCNPDPIRVRGTEGSKHIIYDCTIYKGGFGYNLWVARKYLEM